MRKITQAATNAFMRGINWKQDNTQVLVECGEVKMYLHGNLIARRPYRSVLYSEIELSNAGWLTATTKERLNGLLDAMGKLGIYQRKGGWYWGNGRAFPYNELSHVPIN